MTLHVNDAGTWRQATNVYVNDSGTWREIQEIHVNDAGTWRLVYQVLSVTLTSDGYPRSQGTASVTFANTGVLFGTKSGAESSQYNWLVAGSASNVDLFVTVTSGTLSSGTTDTWVNLSTSRQYTRGWPGGIQSSSVTFTASLRNSGTGVVLATCSITLSATP